MSEDELGQRIGELQRIGKEKGITELLLGLLQFETALTRWRNSLGFFGSKDTFVVLIEPGISGPSRDRGLLLRTVKPYYRFVAALTESEIDEDSARTAISQALSSLIE